MMKRISEWKRWAVSSTVLAAMALGGATGAAMAQDSQDRCSDPRVAKATEEGELIVISSIFETPETQQAHREGFIKYWCLPDDFQIKFDIRNTSGTIARIEAEASAGVRFPAMLLQCRRSPG